MHLVPTRPRPGRGPHRRTHTARLGWSGTQVLVWAVVVGAAAGAIVALGWFLGERLALALT
jgi:hypothetical protein